jgi:hypothetical protein
MQIGIRVTAIPALLLSAVCVGCGPGNPLGRQPVAGKVTLDGKPLATGNIRFAPQQSGGVASGAVITEGQYRLETLHGLPPGKYQVQIYSATAAPMPPEKMAVAGSLPPPAVERIPPQYNTASKLSVEVRAGDAGAFDFQLQTR